MTTTSSPRETFDRQLHKMLDEVLTLGSMVEEAVQKSVESLKQRDMDASRRVYRDDQLINIKRYAIEQSCLTLIATQQPMAGDLRLLAAILEIVTELERIGDYAKGIGKITIMMGKDPLIKPLVDIPKMCDKVLDMLRRALDAFVAQDLEVARSLPQEDDEVDDLYNRVQRDILNILLQKPELIDRANYLLWAAHNLERAADRVTNICERIVFTVTGELIEMDTT
jgi:phosphate transport system protein